MGALLAIIGLIAEGLILTAIAWALSRWLGRVAADREYRFGGDGSQGATDRRKVRTGHVRTHDERSARL